MIENPRRLASVLLACKGRGISVEIIPQSTGDWAVFVDVPTAESSKTITTTHPAR